MRPKFGLLESIRLKLVVLITVPIITFLVLVTWLMMAQFEQTIIDRFKQQSESDLSRLADILDVEFSMLAGVAEMNRSYLEQADFNLTSLEMSKLVKNTLANNDAIYGSAMCFKPFFYSSETRLFCPYAHRVGNQIQTMDIGDVSPQRGYDYTDGDRQWWTKPITTGVEVWSDAYYDDGAGNIVMTTFSTPVMQQGKTVGVTTIDVDLESILDVLNLEAKETLILVNEEGRYIYQKNIDLVLNSAFTEYHPQIETDQLRELFRAITRNKKGVVAVNGKEDDATVWVTFAKLPDVGWYLVRLENEDDAFGDFLASWPLLLVVFIVIAGFIVLFVSWISHRFTQPILELQQAADDISTGDFKVQLEYDKRDELGRLTSEFKAMVKALECREDDMANEVKFRTQELVQSQKEVLQQKERLEEKVDELAKARKAALNIMQDVELARIDLADQLAFQQVLIDTVPNPVFCLDSEGRFLTFNRAYEEMVGVKAEEFTGKTIHAMSFLTTEERQYFHQQMLDVIEHQTTLREEADVTFADGKRRDIVYWMRGFLRTDGTPAGLVGTFLDISEQKEAARQLAEARDKAEAATQAKAAFLASMSHEIRTPMNGIIGMVDLLQQSDFPVQYQDMLQTISDSGQALLTIINDILDISKIESGRMELESIPFNLLEVVEGSVATLAQPARQKRLSLIPFVDPSIPTTLIGDPVRIRQILINLVGNAIKFTEAGDVAVSVALSQKNSYQAHVRLSVIDQGIGIPEKAQAELFHEFTQAESSTSRRYGGTGLGLSICRRLCDIMGGELKVDSEEGVGSHFYVDLIFPFEAAISLPQAHTFDNISILLISQSDAEQNVCASYLRHWLADVSVVSSLEEIGTNSEALPVYDVVILGSSWNEQEHERMIQTLQEINQCAQARFVRLAFGRRHQPRIENDHVVVLDVCPLKRVGFITAVAVCLGRASPETELKKEQNKLATRTAPTIEQARQANCLILVAEDNAVNRDIIGRQLAKLGYACVICEDGLQAQHQLQSDQFALLLTDCHMPNIDGFELTRWIRQQSSLQHMPIVAITANALKGEAERCFSAGMNDYLAKPVELSTLKEKIQQWMPNAIFADSDREPTLDSEVELDSLIEFQQEPTKQRDIDFTVLAQLVGDDKQVLKEILLDYLDTAEQIKADLVNGVQTSNWQDVQFQAHKLKSSSKSIGAKSLAASCQQIESAMKQKQWDSAQDFSVRLQEEFRAVVVAIKRFLED